MVQQQLAAKVRPQPLPRPPSLVAGFDVTYRADQGSGSLVCVDVQTKEVVWTVEETCEVTFPYQPGLLAFRELPVFVAVWKLVEEKPDVVFFDAHGLIHPRRLGLASHASFFAGVPTIGVAKTPFIGTFNPVGFSRGDYSLVVDSSEVIGAAVRSMVNAKPIFVSVGNWVLLEEAVNLTMRMVTDRSRLPLPTFLADQASRKMIQGSSPR